MLDLAPITRYLRAKASSHLLVAATHHLNVFEELSREALTIPELQEKLHLKERPAMVLFPALCAMGMLECSSTGKLQLTEIGKYLTSSNNRNLLGYAGLEQDDAGVIKMTEWLKNDGPANPGQSLSYVKDEEAPSPMDEPESARFFHNGAGGAGKISFSDSSRQNNKA